MTRNIRGISALAAAAGLLLAAGAAHAQDSTTGAIRGTVTDQANGQNVVGATVVATSPALKGSQTVLTDDSGGYYISSLPPGMYEVAVYFVNTQFSRKNVLVRLGKISKVNVTVDSTAGEEKIVIEGRATIVDQDSTKTGTTITQDYTNNIPTGRTFGGVLESGAGNQGDLYGISVGGSTSVENTYIVEGINTTDPGFGLQTTNLPNEFIRETEVITGGYEAEYGRSTGGVINVVTKAGSNEFHGSVFAYWTPGGLTAAADPIAREGDAIRFESNLANAFDIGAEVGGPIVKDKLWFHVGLNPSFRRTDVDRIIQRRVDNDGDGIPDIDPNSGFDVFEPLDTTRRDDSFDQYYYTGKISGAVNQDHQGSLSVLGSPSSQTDFLVGTAGQDSARTMDVGRNIFDIALKWTSKFNDSASQVDIVVGHHRDSIDQEPISAEGAGRLIRYENDRDLATFAGLDPQGVPAECMATIGTGDAAVPACPLSFYSVGGVGFLEDTVASRSVAKASFTQRVKAAGQHRFKVGADIELQGYDSDREFTGGGFFRDIGPFWRVRRFFAVNQDSSDPMATACGSDIDGDGMGEALCEPVDRAVADTSTRNIGLYAQDSWAILPNLTVNLGLRWEQQTLFTAEQVQGQISPTTGEPIPEEAFTLSNMLAPRVGVSYDWTQEGRSKLFAHWGRFYESIPMDINVRAYGGEVLNINFIAPCDTSAGDTGMGSLSDPTCDETATLGANNLLLGGGEELADPDLKAQFLDEVVLGAEYEVIPDLKVSAHYVRRELGRVIEDVSTDGASTYVIANPGEVNQGAVDDLLAQAEAARAAGDEARASQLEFQAEQFANVGIFDEPIRRYNAIVLKADKRFSKNFFLQASYTYSRLEGNFPGLFSPETGQLDPNLTSMFDLPELMANRFGYLAADRPHLIKIDGYYSRAVPDVGRFTIGGRIRGTSGLAVNTLGAHAVYGFDESYILPRGTETDFTSFNGEARTHGRTPFTTRFDTHLAYKRVLTEGIGLEAFVDVFNLFNQQPDLAVDETYTFDDVNPIVGGDSEDLRHLKVLDGDSLSTPTTAEINPNFGNVTAKQAPLSMRFGLRLTF